MFTGLIEAIGIVRALENTPDGKRLTVEAPFASELSVGESVAVHGVCLTVNALFIVGGRSASPTANAHIPPSPALRLAKPILASFPIGGLSARGADVDSFQVDVIPETLALTTFASLSLNDPVHLERALRASDRLGGHFVQGHVDGVATLESVRSDAKGVWWTLRPHQATLMKYIALKGSITLHGVSLTVSDVTSTTFDVALVPHTLEKTLFSSFSEGSLVHVEVDVLARYLERLGDSASKAPKLSHS